MNPAELGAWYGSAFHDHVVGGNELTLRTAYELGRAAVGDGLSLLDLAEAHHDALRREICDQGADPEAAVRAANEFLLESVSAFEMVRRGFEETRQAALVQRARLDMLRQLSDFLADSSLASPNREALEEMLRLIAEQARELVGARLCVVTLTGEPALKASSYSDRTGSLSAEGEVDGPFLSAVAVPLASEQRVAAPLQSLDGKELGLLELIDKEGGFTAADRAAIVHLAQMASAAVERVHLHDIRRTASNGEQDLGS